MVPGLPGPSLPAEASPSTTRAPKPALARIRLAEEREVGTAPGPFPPPRPGLWGSRGRLPGGCCRGKNGARPLWNLPQDRRSGKERWWLKSVTSSFCSSGAAELLASPHPRSFYRRSGCGRTPRSSEGCCPLEATGLPPRWVTALGPHLLAPTPAPFLQPPCNAKARGCPKIPRAGQGLCASASEEAAPKRGGTKPCFSPPLLFLPGLRAACPRGHALGAAPFGVRNRLRGSPDGRPDGRPAPSAFPGTGEGAEAEEGSLQQPSQLSILPQRLPYLGQLGAPLPRAAAALPPHGQPSHRSQESCQEDEAEDKHDFPSQQRHLSLPLAPPRTPRAGGPAARLPATLQPPSFLERARAAGKILKTNKI